MAVLIINHSIFISIKSSIILDCHWWRQAISDWNKELHEFLLIFLCFRVLFRSQIHYYTDAMKKELPFIFRI